MTDTALDTHVDVFFYGLFLDPAVLQGMGVACSRWRRARLDEFELRVGRRAYLEAVSGASVYGAVMTLTAADLRKLYDRDGLDDYRHIDVLATLTDGSSIAASCYNLTAQTGDVGVDSGYVHALVDLLQKHEFPGDYVDRVVAIARTSETRDE